MADKQTFAGKQTFGCVLEKHPGMNAAAVAVPFDVEEVFGSKRVPVIATINGVAHRGTIAKSAGKYWMSVPGPFRKAAAIETGDHIVVTLERDNEPRVVTTPDDFAKALARNADAAGVWEKLSYSHKREYVEAIEEARKAETRRRRIEGAIKMIAAMNKK